jgi:PAS domain S-box-containing protein
MAIERKRAEEALQALSLRQDAILTAVPNIIMEVDAAKVYTWANQAGLEFFGPDVLGKFAEFYFEGEQDTDGAVQPLFEGRSDVVYVESWQRRRDGRRRLLGWSCRALKDGKGNVTGALSSALDITEREQAEEAIRLSLQEKEVLLREIHHRVKNNMQVISSLFSLQAAHSRSEECRGILREAQTRLRSMSLVHEKLYRSDHLSRIDFGGYIHSLAAHLFHVYRPSAGRVRLETDFEDVTLDITSAMPMPFPGNATASSASGSNAGRTTELKSGWRMTGSGSPPMWISPMPKASGFRSWRSWSASWTRRSNWTGRTGRPSPCDSRNSNTRPGRRSPETAQPSNRIASLVTNPRGLPRKTIPGPLRYSSRTGSPGARALSRQNS